MPRFVHIDIAADNPERAAEFYRQAFGWVVTRLPGPMPYWLVAVDPADPTALETVLTGGDDYEILATVPPGAAEAFAEAASRAGVPVTRIGTVRTGTPRVTVEGPDGPLRLGRTSHVHF